MENKKWGPILAAGIAAVTALGPETGMADEGTSWAPKVEQIVGLDEQQQQGYLAEIKEKENAFDQLVALVESSKLPQQEKAPLLKDIGDTRRLMEKQVWGRLEDLMNAVSSINRATSAAGKIGLAGQYKRGYESDINDARTIFDGVTERLKVVEVSGAEKLIETILKPPRLTLTMMENMQRSSESEN